MLEVGEACEDGGDGEQTAGAEGPRGAAQFRAGNRLDAGGEAPLQREGRTVPAGPRSLRCTAHTSRAWVSGEN